MKLTRFFIIGCLVFLHGICLSCSDPQYISNSSPVENAGGKWLSPEEIETLVNAAGQTVYVPVYSHIYHQEDRIYDLTATLSIRNTDLVNHIIITSVRYYNTAGSLVRTYVDSPLRLPHMASLDYVVGAKDTTGGSGANFIVEWQADRQVAEPIVEAIMIGTKGSQGISFLSVGKAIQ